MVIDFVIDPLDRAVSPLWRPGRKVDLATAAEMDLRYEYFWSRISFVVDGFDLGRAWGRVPLLDFSASLRGVLESIGRSGSGNLDFTENSVVVSFSRRGNTIEVTDAAQSNTVICAMDALNSAVDAFLEKLAIVLAEAHPEIGENPFFRRLISATR